MISYSSIAGKMAAATPAGGTSNVTIRNFVFGPATPSVAPGKSVTSGTYEYICGLHPAMKGTVEVT